MVTNIAIGKRRPRWRLLSMVFLLLGAAACAPMADNWRPGDNPKITAVTWTVSRHEIQFVAGSQQPAAGEVARLNAFLAGFDLRRPLHVYVGVGGAADAADAADASGAPEGAETQLAAWRTAAAHALLRQHGISVRADPPPAEAGGALASRPAGATGATGANGAVVLVGRFEVRVAGCPDWRKPVLDEFSNSKSSNFGCASANNLALMIADPEDLVRGREGGPSDGVRAAQTIRDYKSGALPALPDDGPAFLTLPSAAGAGS